jgi:hypothetical protein
MRNRSVSNPLRTRVTIRRHWLLGTNKRIPEEVDKTVEQKLTRRHKQERKLADVRGSVRLEGVLRMSGNNVKSTK